MSVRSDPRETYHTLLLEYASGCLNEAQALAVAAHLALSPSARRLIAQYERIGGALLDHCCEPAIMKHDSLAAVMARLDECGPEPCAKAVPASCGEIAGMPPCLGRYVKTVTWQRAHGVERLEVGTSCTKSRAELVRIAPSGAFAPPRAVRMLLVIDGGLGHDDVRYGRGDLIVTDRVSLSYRAADGGGCTALLVRDGRRVSLAERLRRYLFE